MTIGFALSAGTRARADDIAFDAVYRNLVEGKCTEALHKDRFEERVSGIEALVNTGDLTLEQALIVHAGAELRPLMRSRYLARLIAGAFREMGVRSEEQIKLAFRTIAAGGMDAIDLSVLIDHVYRRLPTALPMPKLENIEDADRLRRELDLSPGEYKVLAELVNDHGLENVAYVKSAILSTFYLSEEDFIRDVSRERAKIPKIGKIGPESSASRGAAPFVERDSQRISLLIYEARMRPVVGPLPEANRLKELDFEDKRLLKALDFTENHGRGTYDPSIDRYANKIRYTDAWALAGKIKIKSSTFLRAIETIRKTDDAVYSYGSSLDEPEIIRFSDLHTRKQSKYMSLLQDRERAKDEIDSPFRHHGGFNFRGDKVTGFELKLFQLYQSIGEIDDVDRYIEGWASIEKALRRQLSIRDESDQGVNHIVDLFENMHRSVFRQVPVREESLERSEAALERLRGSEPERGRFKRWRWWKR